jgi:DNA repair protein RAD5
LLCFVSSKLTLTFCFAPPLQHTKGDSILLSLTPSISRRAFADSNLPRAPDPATLTKKGIHDDLKETDHEKMLRQRKAALNRLFDKTGLQPVALGKDPVGKDGKGKGKGKAGSSQSRRGLLEKYDAGKARKKSPKSGEGEDEEGEEMSEMQLNMVCE